MSDRRAGAAGAPGGAAPRQDRPEDRPSSETVAPLRALWPFVRPHRRILIAALVALFAAAAFTLVVPFALRRVVDVFDARAADLVDAYFLAFFAAAAALAVATALRFYLVTRLGERVVADLRAAVYDNVIGMGPEFFETMRTGETLSRLTTDTTLIQTVVGSSASVALRNVLLAIGGLIMLLVTSPGLTGLVLLAIPFVLGPVIVLGRRLRTLSRESQDTIADASGLAGETLQAHETVQAFTYEAQARRRFRASVETAFQTALRRIETRAALTAVVIFIAFAAVVGVLWIGARSVISGSMSPGELIQFLLLAVFVAGAVGALSEVWGELQRAAGATERLVELLNAPNPIAAPARPTPPPEPSAGLRLGSVAFDAVSFAYPSRRDAPALNGVDFRAEAGERIALVGPSGAGKTTVLQLLLRFYDPDAGQVRLDGLDLRDMDPEALRRRFALVPQEPAIFADTIAENIRFGRPDASDEEVAEAARAAAALDFVHALPDGFRTYVGERGVLLSGGQKQRIAIARAILRDAPVLLLDEATSALDAESERAVQEAIARLSEGRTTIAIAHRLATVRRSDRILVLDAGRIVAEGPHDALVAEGGLYARLARLQFSS